MDQTVPGIFNIGNTCYLNAGLHALASSPSLLAYVSAIDELVQRQLSVAPGTAAQQGAEHMHSDPSSQQALQAAAAEGRLLQELAACLEGLQPVAAEALAGRRLPPVMPAALLRCLKASIPEDQLQWGCQHDAAEALEALLGVVQQEAYAWCRLHAVGELPGIPSGLRALAPEAAGALQRAQSLLQELLCTPSGGLGSTASQVLAGLSSAGQGAGGPLAAGASSSGGAAASPWCQAVPPHGSGTTPAGEAGSRQHEVPECQYEERGACAAGEPCSEPCQAVQAQQHQLAQQAQQHQLSQQAELYGGGSWEPPSCSWEHLQRWLSTPPTQGCLLHCLMCLACGHRFTSSLTPFTVLPLPLPQARNAHGALCVRPGTGLLDCLAGFMAPETVQGCLCPSCSMAATVACTATGRVPAGAAGGSSGGGHAPAVSAESRRQALMAAYRHHLHTPAHASQDAPAGALNHHRHVSSEGVAPQQPSRSSSGGGGGSLPAASSAVQAAAPCASSPRAGQARRELLARLAALSASPGNLPECDYSAAATAAGVQWVPTRAAAAKQVRLARAPRALLVQLQRSVHTGTGLHKLQGWLEFPLQLDLRPYLAFAPEAPVRACGPQGHGQAGSLRQGQQQQQQQQQADGTRPEQVLPPTAQLMLPYHLVAVVQHLGGASGGHYVMYRRLGGAATPPPQQHPTSKQPAHGGAPHDGDAASSSPPISSAASKAGACPASSQAGGGQWVMVSDERVRAAEVQEVLRCQAALLLYERATPAGPP